MANLPDSRGIHWPSRSRFPRSRGQRRNMGCGASLEGDRPTMKQERERRGETQAGCNFYQPTQRPRPSTQISNSSEGRETRQPDGGLGIAPQICTSVLLQLESTGVGMRSEEKGKGADTKTSTAKLARLARQSTGSASQPDVA